MIMSKTAATLRICLTILGITTVLSLQAQPQGHYRWKDTAGNTHYSDRPPEGVESEFIKFATGKRAKPPAEEAAENAQKSASGDPKKMEILPEKDPKLCKQAQGNLAALASARIRITESDGTQRILTEEEKEEQRGNARKFIKLHCN
jgi:Domain of unknown function (DUF4124)